MSNSSTSGKPGLPPASKRRMRLWMFGVCCFLLWAVYNIWGQAEKLSAKAMQLSEMEAKLQEVRAEHEAHQLEITRLNDSEYIEQRIRKDYHYTRSGETMFYTPKPKQ